MRVRFTARLASAAQITGAITAAALTFGAGGASASAIRPAASANTVAAGDVVVIHSLYRGAPAQCLDADINGGGVNGNKVQIWTCNGSPQQEWMAGPGADGAWSLESMKFPGMCLDADLNGGGANGTKVQLWRCNQQAQQSWYWYEDYDLAIYNALFNNNQGIVLDRDINVPGNGAKVQLWAKNFQSQQWWS